MKAVALTAPGRVQVVDDWPDPECGPGDVVVRVRAVGLCGTDLAVYGGKRAVPAMPWVMGHEDGGEIVAIGADVRDREVGQRVVIEPNVPDGTCPMCQAGRSSACKNREIVGVNRTGILANRVVVPAAFAWAASATWSDQALACFEPLAVAYTAVTQDYAAALQAVASGTITAEATVQAGFPAEEEAAAFAGARDVPGKSWISMA